MPIDSAGGQYVRTQNRPRPRFAVKNKFLDTDHPMFRPLWVRLLVVASAGGWGVVEVFVGSPFWAMIFLGLAAYAAWAFFMGSRRGGPGPDA